MADNPLGKAMQYPDQYQPGLLAAIPRQDNRTLLGLHDDELPFTGADVWNAWELSCLDKRGKPHALTGRFLFPCESPNLIESKSLKLYLNSLNQEKFDSLSGFRHTLEQDLSRVSGGQVTVVLTQLDETEPPGRPSGQCLDELEISPGTYTVSRELLAATGKREEETVAETLYTNLFRCNCPITGQPDWGTVTVAYRGRKIPHGGLLEYLVSYRLHNDYHENCMERIFCDLHEMYGPDELTVWAGFLRRGGLDINPIRTSRPGFDYTDIPRLIRQ